MVASGCHYGTVKELNEALAARRISVSELVELVIARIEALDLRINAVVVRDFERAREAARAADLALARGEPRPLLGIPFTVKEAINVADLPTTWGFPQFKDFVPQQDAVVVTRAKNTGAILLGKTNVPLGLGDFQSYNDIYGTTNNPWDISRSPGGSSGGSAAALAAGFGTLSFGSDIGGSLRVPAHFCGVYAHKPTFGLLPSRGYNRPPNPPLPVSGDLAVMGPMARTAPDLALALDRYRRSRRGKRRRRLSADAAACAAPAARRISRACHRRPPAYADGRRRAQRHRRVGQATRQGGRQSRTQQRSAARPRGYCADLHAAFRSRQKCRRDTRNL